MNLVVGWMDRGPLLVHRFSNGEWLIGGSLVRGLGIACAFLQEYKVARSWTIGGSLQKWRVDRWWVTRASFQKWRVDRSCNVGGSLVPCFRNGGWVAHALLQKSWNVGGSLVPCFRNGGWVARALLQKWRVGRSCLASEM